MEEEVVKEPMEEEVEEDTYKKKTEEDAVDHNEKDDAEIKDIFGSPTPKDSANDLTDFKFFSSLLDDLDTNGSLDQQRNVGVPQDLGPVPDNSGINEVINERLDEHMGADVTQAEKQEPALSPIPEDSLIDVHIGAWFQYISSKRDEYMKEYAMKGSAYQAVYNLWGFAFALKVLVLETFPQSKLWWEKDENAFPRGVGWRDVRGFSKSDHNSLFYAATSIKPIIPTDAERASLWWISSIDYLDNPIVSSPRKNKKVKRDKIKYRVCQNFHQKGKRTSVHIRTEVHTSVVNDGSSHDNDSSNAEVDESLRRMSNKQLLKYVASMEGRLAAVEKLVKPLNVPIDVTVPAVNHPAKEPVADSKIVIELTGDVEKPKVCITKIVVNIYELFFNRLLIC
ncbi:hypothetical protein CTI12_AA264200 [Artemisia annua]|uniref:Uncharacterized protein n=1 Tax=Artemisia annua TaxID=35608 RepID=A0A2U1NHR2_ARTAN|nr:hypothetical protein CTI12_AA264200 [Artemisia annua]